MAKDRLAAAVAAVATSTGEGTARPVALVPVRDAEKLADEVHMVRHFLRVFEDLAGGPPGRRIDIEGESFGMVMMELADRCKDAAREIEKLGGMQ